MSERIEIKANETGIVRVFAVDIPKGGIPAFTARNGRWPLREALGADSLDPEHVEVFDAADLAGMGLPGYLIDGHAVPEDQIAPLRGRLDALDGTLMVVTSRAFGGTAQVLTPRAPVRLVATLSETQTPITFGALPDASAWPEPPAEEADTHKTPSDAAMSGRIATVVLLVLALLVVVMVWVAS